MQSTLPPVEGAVYYLASPYSSKNEYVKEHRYLTICAISAALTNMGYLLIEPIGASHPIARMFKLPTGYEFWKTRDRALIERSNGVIVAMMDGWEQSVGVTDEIEFATSIGKPVYYLNPEDVLETVQAAV
jgi:hypothetical protein